MKLKPDVARTTATFAKAFVGNRRVMVNEPALAEWPWPERVVTLAHEIVHACQLELSGHRGLVRYQWVRGAGHKTTIATSGSGRECRTVLPGESSAGSGVH